MKIGAASDIFNTLPVAFNNVTSASGYIYDDATKQILPASIQLLVTNTGQPYNGDVPLFLSDGNYSAWTDGDPNAITVKFTAAGYTPVVSTINILSQSPDVYMNKSGSSNLTLPLLLGAGLLLFTTNGNKKRGRQSRVGSPQITTGTIVTIGAAFLLLKGIQGISNIGDLFGKLEDAIGLGTDPTKAAQTDPGSPWKPTYWQQYTDFPNGALTEDTAKDLGSTIHDAFTLFEDDYNAIYGAISTLKSKVQVSFLAWEFNKQYSEDLLSFLTNGGGIMPWDGLNSTHLKTLIDLVNNLPAN